MFKKVFVLERVSYGDFDIAQSTPVAVSANREALNMLRSTYMSNRTAADIKAEVKFEISPDRVLNLDDAA